MTRLFPRWSAQELVVVGVFAAASKVSTLLIALAGGGMNPVSLMGKNLVFTTLLVVMLCKVRRPGTLFLFTVINIIVSMLLLGASVTLIPPMLMAALVAEAAMWLGRHASGAGNALLGAAVFDFVSKALSLCVSWLFMRENPALMLMVVPFVVIGYFGSLGGLFSGVRAVRELRHAGIIRE